MVDGRTVQGSRVDVSNPVTVCMLYDLRSSNFSMLGSYQVRVPTSGNRRVPMVSPIM